MATVTICDESLAGKRSEEYDLEFASATITARELIQRRVEEEVRHYNLNQSAYFRGLVQPTDAELTLNGYKMRHARRIDAAVQVERALQAFESNGFFLLVDDRQVESLDQEIRIGLKTRVSFVKLVPLVGG